MKWGRYIRVILVESLASRGEDPQVTIFWGDEDAGETTNLDASSSGWDNSIDLGTLFWIIQLFSQWSWEVGKVFFYRILLKMQLDCPGPNHRCSQPVILNLI